MAQASFVRLPVVGTPHSAQGIGEVSRARRLHLIQDRACGADAKFGEHGRRGVIGHVCDLLRCRFGIHAGVDLDDVFFRLLQEIFAQLQPFFVFGPLRLEFIDALPEFVSAASSPFCCHATRASSAASAMLLQNCVTSDSRLIGRCRSVRLSWPAVLRPAFFRWPPSSGAALAAAERAGLAGALCREARNGWPAYDLANRARFSGFAGFCAGWARTGALARIARLHRKRSTCHSTMSRSSPFTFSRQTPRRALHAQACATLTRTHG